MHYLGLVGVPRRFYELGETAFVPHSAAALNIFITVAALIVGRRAGDLLLQRVLEPAPRQAFGGSNPWRAASLEWQTPETPPGHGNWGKELPDRLSLGLRLQRSGRAGGLPAAERAALEGRALAMSVMGLFFILIASTALWWLARQGVLRSSFAEEGEIADFPGAKLLPRPPAAKVGLGVFSPSPAACSRCCARRFFMRMDAPDWQAPPISRDFMVQHGGLDREQRRAGSGATRRRPARNRRPQELAAGRRRMRRAVPARAVLGLARDGGLWASTPRATPPTPSSIC